MPTRSKAFPPGKCDRKTTRYWLFRKQNELMGGAKAAGAPKGLFAGFEEQPAFILAGGYKTFAETWDIDRKDPGKIVPRDQSIEQEWNTHLQTAAVPHPLPIRHPGESRGPGPLARTPLQAALDPGVRRDDG